MKIRINKPTKIILTIIIFAVLTSIIVFKTDTKIYYIENVNNNIALAVDENGEGYNINLKK